MRKGRSSTLYYTMEEGSLSSVNLERRLIYGINKIEEGGSSVLKRKGFIFCQMEGLGSSTTVLNGKRTGLSTVKIILITKIIDVFIIFK